MGMLREDVLLRLVGDGPLKTVRCIRIRRSSRPSRVCTGDLPAMVLIDPVGHEEFVHLMARAYNILTDGGGVQEEAPLLGKPVLVLRGKTERPEGVDAGTAVVVGTRREQIVTVASELLTSREAYHQRANAVNPYGDGHASERIVAALAERFG